MVLLYGVEVRGMEGPCVRVCTWGVGDVCHSVGAKSTVKS